VSKVFFPAGLTIDFRDINLEEMEFYARGWNLERRQMQKGLFKGSMIAAHTPRMQLFRANHSHGVLLKGDFPKDTILIAFVATKAEITFQNKIADKHQIKILKSGDEIDFLCNGESVTYTIAVAEQLFYDDYYAYFHEDINTHKKNNEMYISPQLFTYFIQGIERWMTYLLQNTNHTNIQNLYCEIESNILEHIFSCIYLQVPSKKREKFDIIKARDILHEFHTHDISINSVANKLAISTRLLHHSFLSTYGFSPKKYHMALRMHAVKQELLLLDSSMTKIASVIEKYHFFNQNTFTQAYKQMFKELPSQTLNKSI